MTTAAKPSYPDDQSPVELYNGDRMTREEFHKVYERAPEDLRAELIGGIVYVASPLKRRHGKSHSHFTALLIAYEASTAGVEVCDNASVFLSDEDEVQPDLFMRILPEYGGQSTNTIDEYIAGAPELVVEVTHTTRSIDLNSKKDRYAEDGVIEYIVLCLQPRHLRWFDLRNGQDLTTNSDDGIMRSKVFPGLWIRTESLLQLDYHGVMEVLNKGLSSPEHENFVHSIHKEV